MLVRGGRRGDARAWFRKSLQARGEQADHALASKIVLALEWRASRSKIVLALECGATGQAPAGVLQWYSRHLSSRVVHIALAQLRARMAWVAWFGAKRLYNQTYKEKNNNMIGVVREIVCVVVYSAQMPTVIAVASAVTK